MKIKCDEYTLIIQNPTKELKDKIKSIIHLSLHPLQPAPEIKIKDDKIVIKSSTKNYPYYLKNIIESEFK